MKCFSVHMIVPDEFADLILANIPNLRLERIQCEADHLRATATNQQPSSTCPSCGTPSSSVHSHYERGVRDLPASGTVVTWKLRARRFRCRNPACQQRVFCERYRTGLNPRARRTTRLTQTLEHVSLVVGASVGARIAQYVRAPSSPSILLRIAHRSQPPPRPEPRVIGVDDFAFRQGVNYGTVKG